MDTSLFAHVDLYCERLGPGLWAEPANALTNLAFIVAGIWGLLAVRRHGTGTYAEALAWWAVAIGIGSGIFHTFATRLTIWFDILPIATFVLAYTLFALRRFIGLSWGRAILVLVCFYGVVGMVTALIPVSLHAATNGTTGYLPAFVAVFFFAALTIRSGSPAGYYILAAAGIFLVSVTCRIIDPLVCDAFPLGTHFLWHLLNGLMIAVLLAASARHGASRGGLLRTA